MAKKIRTYEDYQRIGAKLRAARDELATAYRATSWMFGKTRPETQAVKNALRALEEARVKIDDTYCEEIPASAVPTGGRHFPIYPGHLPV
jgi:hypothetical protein